MPYSTQGCVYMKNIPVWVVEEVVELRDSNHSFDAIVTILRKKGFPLERHTVAKVYTDATNKGVTSSNKSPQTPEESIQSKLDDMKVTFRKHAEEMKAGLKNEVTKEMVIGIMHESEICPCEDCERYRQYYNHYKEKLQEVQREKHDLQSENEGLKLELEFKRISSIKLATIEKFLKTNYPGLDPEKICNNYRVVVTNKK